MEKIVINKNITQSQEQKINKDQTKGIINSSQENVMNIAESNSIEENINKLQQCEI